MHRISPISPHRSANGDAPSPFQQAPRFVSASAWKNRKTPREPMERMTNPPVPYGTCAICSSLTDDPSLLIPVEEAWKAGGKKLAALTRNGSNVREFLLSSLGQASGICPSITASLENARLAGYSLDAAKAHEFLTQEAVALEQAGYGVMLPAWWTRKGTKVRLAVQARAKSPKMQGGSGLSPGDDCPVRLGGGPRRARNCPSGSWRRLRG